MCPGSGRRPIAMCAKTCAGDTQNTRGPKTRPKRTRPCAQSRGNRHTVAGQSHHGPCWSVRPSTWTNPCRPKKSRCAWITSVVPRATRIVSRNASADANAGIGCPAMTAPDTTRRNAGIASCNIATNVGAKISSSLGKSPRKAVAISSSYAERMIHPARQTSAVRA